MMGGALGLAVLASLAAARTDDLLASGAGSLVALNGGYHAAFVVGAVFAAAAALLGAALIRAGRQAPAERRSGSDRGLGFRAALTLLNHPERRSSWVDPSSTGN